MYKHAVWKDRLSWQAECNYQSGHAFCAILPLWWKAWRNNLCSFFLCLSCCPVDFIATPWLQQAYHLRERGAFPAAAIPWVPVYWLHWKQFCVTLLSPFCWDPAVNHDFCWIFAAGTGGVYRTKQYLCARIFEEMFWDPQTAWEWEAQGQGITELPLLLCRRML